MTTVESYTKAKVDELIGATIVDADVVGGELVFTKEDGSTVNVGSVGGIKKVTAFPTVPAPADGDMIVHTAQSGDPLYKFTDGAWELQPRMGALTVPSTRLSNTASQSIPNGAQTTLSFDIEDRDTDTLHDTVTNTSRITIKTPGVYLIAASARFAANATGTRVLGAWLNGSTRIKETEALADSVSGEPTILPLITTVRLSAGDYIEARVYQSSGGALNVDSTNGGTTFEAVWLGGAGQTVDERSSSAAKVNHTGTQSIPISTYTAISMTGVLNYDTDGMYSSGASTRLTAKTPGVYRIVGEIEWVANTTSVRQAALCKNGSTYFGFSQIPPAQAGGTYQQVIGEVLLAAGDYVEVQGWHNVSSPLGVDGGHLSASLVATGKTITPYASAHTPANLTNLFANGVWTAIPFAGEASDNDNIHDTSSNTTRLTCKTAGVYAIQGMAVFALNGTGKRQVGIWKNAAEIAYFISGLPAAGASSQTSVPISCIMEMAVGDYIELVGFQDSGGSLNSLGDPNFDGDRCHLKMVKVGSPSSPSATLGPTQSDVYTLATLPAPSTFPNGRIVGVSDGVAGQQARMAMNGTWLNLG